MLQQDWTGGQDRVPGQHEEPLISSAGAAYPACASPAPARCWAICYLLHRGHLEKLSLQSSFLLPFMSQTGYLFPFVGPVLLFVLAGSKSCCHV